jgi:Ca2+-binding RTX toxin-like protein
VEAAWFAASAAKRSVAGACRRDLLPFLRKKDGEFYASTTNAGTQSGPRAAALPSGGYVAVWESDSGADIGIQRFDSAGAMVGGEIFLTSFGFAEPDPEVAVLSSGAFVVVWKSQDAQYRDYLTGQVYAADGIPDGVPFVFAPVRGTATDYYRGVSIFALPTGGFVLAWQGDDTVAQVFDSAGAAVGDQILLDTGAPYGPTVTALIGDDRFIIVWPDAQGINTGSFSLQYKGQVIDSSGDKVGATIEYGNMYNPSVAALADGGFVLAWETAAGGPMHISAQRYDVDGVAVGPELAVTSASTSYTSQDAKVLALPWGGFIVAWDTNMGGELTIQAQLFDADGNKVGTPSRINTQAMNPGLGLDSFELELLAFGDVVALWSNEGGSGPAQLGIKSQLLSLPTVGTAAGETLDGTAGDDGIVALGGDDVVNGAAGDDDLSGGAGDDRLAGGGGADGLDGGAGTDTADYSGEAGPVFVNLRATAFMSADGHPFATRLLGPGEAIDGVGQYDRLTAVENLILTAGNDRADGSDGANRIEGGDGDDILNGLGGDDMLEGGDGNDELYGGDGVDFLRLQGGGVDRAVGGGGNDVFLFGAALTSADSASGGAGSDQIAIQGDYAGANALTLGASVFGFESIAILPGNDIRFGDPGTNLYDYDITTVNANVAAGVQVIVDANRLRLGEDLVFNGSAESDGGFFVWGGGGVDTLTGGSMTDIFYFGENGQFGASDVVNGGVGIDQLGLRGNYTIVFGAGQLTGIENIGLVSAQDTRFGALGTTYNYNLTLNDANLASGVLMTVDGAALRGGETLTFNGSAETNGNFRIFGGQGNDAIVTGSGNDIIQGGRGADDMTGGAGADTFRYFTALDSTAAAIDEILDFAPGTDKIDLSRIDANTLAGGDQAFSWIGSNAFTGGGAASAGELRAYGSGGDWFVEGDDNGDGAADLVIRLTAPAAPVVQSDFLL